MNTAAVNHQGHNHGIVKRAMAEALPSHFNPDGYVKMQVHVSNVQSGDIVCDEQGRRSSHGAVVQLFDTFIGHEKRWFAQTESFVPLVEIVGYLSSPMSKGSAADCVHVYRPANHQD